MAAYDKYDTKIEYWLDYYEGRINLSLSQVNMQLRSAQERKRSQEFEFKLYLYIMLAVLVMLPVSFALGMSGMPLMILGGILMLAEIFAIVFVIPLCIYKLVKGMVCRVINDKDNSLGDYIVQKYHVPRLSGEIMACQIHIGRYKEYVSEISDWRELLHKGTFEMDENELRERMEKIDFEPKIEISSDNNYKLRHLIQKITISIIVVVFGIILWLGVNGYISYYLFFLDVWRSM